MHASVQAPVCSTLIFASQLLHAGDYSFAFAGLQVTVAEMGAFAVSVGLTQLAISKQGAINPAVYPNLALPSDWWTPRCVHVQPARARQKRQPDGGMGVPARGPFEGPTNHLCARGAAEAGMPCP